MEIDDTYLLLLPRRRSKVRRRFNRDDLQHSSSWLCPSSSHQIHLRFPWRPSNAPWHHRPTSCTHVEVKLVTVKVSRPFTPLCTVHTHINHSLPSADSGSISSRTLTSSSTFTNRTSSTHVFRSLHKRSWTRAQHRITVWAKIRHHQSSFTPKTFHAIAR